MKRCIGIDFDNTIVTYDKVFHKYALETGLISQGVEKNKKAVRDAIRTLPSGNDKWTKLQGLVYSKYIEEAELMQGVQSFLKTCKENSVKAVIISHKTTYPAIGPRINLRTVARRWLENRDFLTKFGLADSDIVFKETLDEKLAQITEKGCDYFIDDLPEVLAHPDFPKGVKKILYGKRMDKNTDNDILNFEAWHEIKKYFFE